MFGDAGAILGAMKCRHTRAGFTLPEVLLATMLLVVGIGALAAAATYIAAESADSRRIAEAAQLVGGTLDSLRSVPCVNLSSGIRAVGTASVSWTVSAAHSARAIHAVLTTANHARVRTYALDTMVPCEG